MIKCDELSNPQSCLNKAAPDEPVFVLRANDPSAPAIVREWAAIYRAQKVKELGGYLNREQFDKNKEALETAVRMEQWRDSRRFIPLSPPVKWVSVCERYWTTREIIDRDGIVIVIPTLPSRNMERCIRCGWLPYEHAR